MENLSQNISEENSRKAENNGQNFTITDVISVLGKNYRNVFLVNKETKKVQICQYLNPEVGVEDLISVNQPYEVVVNAYIDNNVFMEDREKMRAVMEFDYIRNQMEQVQQFTVHYRVKRDEKLSYYYMKCARIGENEDFQEMVLAFANEDEDVRRNELENVIKTGKGKVRRKILIVEDNRLTREVLEAILDDEYEILKAENGEVGLQILQDHYRDIALILLDVQMPVCNGFQFMERIKDDAVLSSIPIIVTTASNEPRTELEFLNMGVKDYIQKPYNVQVVRKRVNNIVELREFAMTLEAVEIDKLTGVYTRHAFMHHLGVLMEMKKEEKIQLVIAEVQDFKLVNSTYGIPAADELLRYLADAYKHSMNSGLLARVGIHAFACVMYGDDCIAYDNAVRIAREIEKGQPIANAKVKYGIYEDIDKALSPEALCDCGFTAIESIEHDYEQDIAYYSYEMLQKKIHDKKIESAFENAVEKQEFQVYYQPKISTKDESVVGAEALARWIRTDGSKVFPGEFIPIYEKDGLIVKLDEYVFREVCSFQKKHMERGEALKPISVNLSRASIFREGVAERYIQIVKEYGIPYTAVPLEVTESAVMRSEQIREAINELVAAGFKLHMDDFGSGYSSLTNLNQIPFSVMKIDKSLVDDILEEKGRIVMEQVVSLARMLNLETVAEGVEDREQLEILKRMNVNMIQGYYYARPMPEEEFEEYCTSMEKK